MKINKSLFKAIIGSKNRDFKKLGEKQGKLKETEDDINKTFLKHCIQQVYKNTQRVKEINFNNKKLFDILKNDISITKYKNVIICRPDKNYKFISTNDIFQDMSKIYEFVQQKLKNFVPPKMDEPPHNIECVYSYGEGSILGEYISIKYGLKHVAFNPMLFYSIGNIFKVKGDPFSLFSYSDDCYELNTGHYRNLTDKAFDLKIFESNKKSTK